MGIKKMTDESGTLWDVFNPFWMLYARPADYAGRRVSLCRGVFWLAGLQWLFLFHLACFTPFIYSLLMSGYRPTLLLYLAPVAIAWLFLFTADIKFRMQGSTSDSRANFDDAFLNWFGCLATIVSFCAFPVAAIIGIVAFVRHLFI